MNPASEVLLSIATELANMAKASLPKLNDGEKVQREWLEDGIYCRETTFDICFYGIVTLLLQFVCFQFIDQADAASFLTQIQQHSSALFCNRFHGRI